MRIKVTQRQGFLFLWQLIALALIYYGIWNKDILVGVFGTGLLIVQFQRINKEAE